MFVLSTLRLIANHGSDDKRNGRVISSNIDHGRGYNGGYMELLRLFLVRSHSTELHHRHCPSEGPGGTR